MSTLLKVLSTTFFIMIAVTLIICFMEVGDELNHTDFILFGLMMCVAITGCIGASVAISTIK